MKVELLITDDMRVLMARGKHSAAEIIDAAVECDEIGAEDTEWWERYDRIETQWYKVVPRDGFSKYYYPVAAGTTGSFLATCIIKY